MTSGEAVADGSSPTAVSYKVVTTTGSAFGAGTDAKVIATVFGSKGDTGPHELDNSSNNFERGATDTFFIQVHAHSRLLDTDVLCLSSALQFSLIYMQKKLARADVHSSWPAWQSNHHVVHV